MLLAFYLSYRFDLVKKFVTSVGKEYMARMEEDEYPLSSHGFAIIFIS